MVEKVYVGTGGWYDYKKDIVSPNLRLKAYAKKFNFVEVNGTFYKIFHPSAVERWRKLVPDNFQFGVKCYRALTHTIGIRPVKDAFQTMDLMLSYCRILNAEILVLESPPSLLIDDKFVKDAREFFSASSLKNVRIAWEFRRKNQDMPDNLINLMRDLNIIHVVDMIWEEPLYETNILYTRVFGNPQKGFLVNNENLRNLENKVMKSRSRTAYVSTHGLRMVQDAERLRELLVAQ